MLARRGSVECHHCGQDLSDAMIAKMRAHAGPWYVLEHVRPFPGVNLDRIVRQIRRGVLTETSIIRGPATDYQWRFAVETPGLCRYFNRCWNCHEEVTPKDSHCPACLSDLSFDRPQVRATQPPPRTKDRFAVENLTRPTEPLLQPTPPIQELTTALSEADAPSRRVRADGPARIGRFSVGWIIAVLLAAVILVLVWVTSVRSQRTGGDNKPAPTALAPSQTG
jgi:hypothetical protein